MIYTNAEVLAVGTGYVTVYNSDVGNNIAVYLPSVISRYPVVGDHIIYDKDDVDDDNGMFINYQSTTPTEFSTHQHQLLSDSVIADMALGANQKAEIKQKTTGGVQ